MIERRLRANSIDELTTGNWIPSALGQPYAVDSLKPLPDGRSWNR